MFPPRFFQLISYSVASATDPAVIRLSDLRLDDARALLEHDPSCVLPEPEASPIVYVQSVLDGLCELSLRDPLTGLSNRRHFNHLLNREIESVARSGESVLLLMLDIDHFKKVNDTYGHHAGDLVLQAVSKCLEACVRPMDTVSRFGGEEFAAILPNCPSTFAPIVAERIRLAVSELAITVSPSETIHVTISIGGAFAPEWVRSTIELWTERADEQLYRAKSAGRNCIFIEEQRGVAVSADEKGMLFGNLLFGDPASGSVAEDVSNSAVADSEMNRAI
jgi:two-component system cell cycle response regulator